MCLPALPSLIRRWSLFIGGLALLTWLRLEQNDVLSAAIAGWMTILLIAARLILRQPRVVNTRTALIASPLIGLGVGLGAGLATAGLMLLKNGMHGHVFPDYPFGLIAGILERTPIWAVAAALISSGVVCAWMALAPSMRAPSQQGEPHEPAERGTQRSGEKVVENYDDQLN